MAAAVLDKEDVVFRVATFFHVLDSALEQVRHLLVVSVRQILMSSGRRWTPVQ